MNNIEMKGMLTILISAMLVSCDCVQHVSGTVIDKKTKEPIEGALIVEQHIYGDPKTNDKGEFGLRGISGGIFRCPPMKVTITKEGYKSKRVRIGNTVHRTVMLKKLK